ncbi:hypothetical protein BC827DRAFT_1266465 [Russula dissimulans]|nr:hypothetical protein BC827DRAFT_1266465 [Russula dissimulans]
MFENPESIGVLDFKIIVPDAMIEYARCQWASPSDPVFEIVPPVCQEHISSIYVQLGSPAVNFRSFWEVYNLLRDTVDLELLLFTKATTDTLGDAPEDSDGDIAELPLHQLRPCEFGTNGIPAVRTIPYEESSNALTDSEKETEPPAYGRIHR